MHANEDIFYIRKAQRWFSPYFYLILSDWRFLRKRPWIPVVDKVHWRINEFLVFLPLSVLFPYPRRNPAFFFSPSFFAALATALIKKRIA